ncbi:glycosyltransferase family 2 protein [Leeuwenhoekiella marinoflava]|uniref:glycosyltransferase family 2 protein n=1 Tax=Leeuwenhoekiella marinoflava TaxID=988 RepID=UPI003002C4EA
MKKLTVIIPTYNEALHIEAAIKSVLFADEIVIVDSFSTDATIQLAKKFPVKIIQRDYEYSASQKNWAIPQAKHDWVFILDADERVTVKLKEEILKILQNPPKTITGYWVYRKNHFINQHIKYSGWQNDKVIRLFKKNECKYEDKRVHAEIETSGNLAFLKYKLEHYSFMSVDQYTAKLNRYASWQAQDYDSKTGLITPYHLFCKPAWRFIKHYFIQQGFRDGLPGFTISYLQAYAAAMRYIKLWILRKSKK